MTPTARTLAALRRQEYRAEKVGRWVPWERLRTDLLGFADILAARGEGDPILAVAVCTTLADASARMARIKMNDAAKLWIQRGHRLQVWGWSRGGRPDKGAIWEMKYLSARDWLNG